MRPEALRVVLRPRSPWEAVELGAALVRQQASPLWKAWFASTLPVFAVVNALAWWGDVLWLALLLMWWITPLFDRIVLFVLSRAVFGASPTALTTLQAMRYWGWRPMWGYLLWRRLSPWRSLTLPVDLLEGGSAEAANARRKVIGHGVIGHAFVLTVSCQAFIAILAASCISLVLLFVPTELLSESARAVWTLMTDAPPRWAQLVLNLVVWLGVSAIEPFFVGAGFGLYLNRRVQLEAWDIEIVLRKLRARIAPLAATWLLVLAWPLLSPAQAQSSRHHEAPPPVPTQHVDQAGLQQAPDTTGQDTLGEVFGEDNVVDSRGFARAVAKAAKDPLLDHKRTDKVWQRRDRTERADTPPAALPGLARLFALVGEFGLWFVVAVLVLVLALTARRWWPWMRGWAAPLPKDREIVSSPMPPDEPLPPDLATQARRLWREGWPRRALALLYRGSVAAMAERLQVTPVPGATEAECLRLSRRLPDPADRDVFARVVRTWQYAAYAQRLPDETAFEQLLGDASQRFGWLR